MGFPFLSGWAYALAGRLLRPWVRARVFPAQAAELGLDPAKPVCYVLQGRRLTNLLVLDEEARRAGLPPPRAPLVVGPFRNHRSFFFLTRPQPLAGGAKARYGHSPLLAELLRALGEDAAADVQLVPVTLLWGQAPGKQSSILKALFSESWRPPGHLRQILAVLLNGRQTLLRFGAPFSLRALAAEAGGESQALRKVGRVLRVHFRRQRQAAIGPDLSHRNLLIDAMLAAPGVRAAVAAEAAAGEMTAQEAAGRARACAMEIAADYSHGVVRALELFLDWLWNRLYEGIAVHRLGVLEGIAPGSGIVYLPCHRSHIDYLLLSFVIFRHGRMPPHIAAGANLDLPLVGPLLRRGGAFFLRRSFKGNRLYAAVFDEYLHRMLSRGFPIEYFIEGGRSRHGRMLPPKAGLLAMTVKSFLRVHERPLVFVPVYIGYEKLLEGGSYVAELAGQPKQGESLRGLLRAARLLRDRFGRVHVNFGRPLDLGAFLDTTRPGWQAEADPAAGAWLRAATGDLAEELARRINEAAVPNPVNLAALALLATPGQAAGEAALGRLVAHWQALLAGLPRGEVAVPCQMTEAEAISAAERLGSVERLADPLGDLLRVAPGQGPRLAYFRNNLLHLAALPSLVACLLARNSRLPAARLEAAVAALYPCLRAELFLPWSEAEAPALLAAVLAGLSARGLLVRDGDWLEAPPPAAAEAFELRCLGEPIRPLLERQFLVLAQLARQGSGKATRADLEEGCARIAHRQALLKEAEAGEAAASAQIAALVARLIDAGLLDEDAAGCLRFDTRVAAAAAHAELLLSAETRAAIGRG